MEQSNFRGLPKRRSCRPDNWEHGKTLGAIRSIGKVPHRTFHDTNVAIQYAGQAPAVLSVTRIDEPHSNLYCEKYIPHD
jgi:hypothetical protein